MRKWRISVSWETEIEADDEGQALIDADSTFSFMREARAEEITPDDTDENDDYVHDSDMGARG
jgi:hypothetical protein